MKLRHIVIISGVVFVFVLIIMALSLGMSKEIVEPKKNTYFPRKICRLGPTHKYWRSPLSLCRGWSDGAGQVGGQARWRPQDELLFRAHRCRSCAH